MKILDQPKTIRLKIMDFLSRREHSAKEILNELRQRGIKERIFDSIQRDTDWTACALKALKKKTNGKYLVETNEILKLKKFLNYRGFEFQDIDKAFSEFNKENL